jgi:Fe-S cluster biogenesis protein NfuA
MSAEHIKQQTRKYLSENVPQIDAHGGSVTVREIDEADATATVEIGGACSGCGIAPMRMSAIESRLPDSIDSLDDADVVRSGERQAAVLPSKTEDMEEMPEYTDYDLPF